MAGRINNKKLSERVQAELKNINQQDLYHECPYCHQEADLLFKIQSANNHVDIYNYYKCRQCDIIFLGSLFYEFIDGIYIYKKRETNFVVQDDFFSNSENYKRPDYMYKYWENEKNQIVRLYPEGGKILDIGCAAGQFLDKFDNQFEKYGIEISDLALIAQCKNINVTKKPVEEIGFADGYFDVISAYALIEHLEDPFSFLKKISRWLKDGGLLVLGTNDINCLLTKYRKEYYQDLIPPEHIILLSYNFCRNFLYELGYKIIFKKYINGGYSFSDNRLMHLLEYGICRVLINWYPFNQLPIYDHFYIYAEKIKK